MKLAQVGEGNYTQQDIVETARALTDIDSDQICQYFFSN